MGGLDSKMVDDADRMKEPGRPLELLILAVMGLLTVVALLMILTDMQGWI